MIANFVVAGIPVSVHWTTVFLFILFSADAFIYAKSKMRGIKLYIVAFLASCLVVFSVVVHETAHALTANALGYQITSAGINGAMAYVSNDVALSQIPPYKELLIAAAGPVSNVILVLFFIPLIYWSKKSALGVVTRYFSIISIKLARINLWPILFLDGGRLTESLLRMVFGQSSITAIASGAISALFIAYLFSKKKGHFEIEDLIEKIP